MEDKKIIRYGVPVAAILGVFVLKMITGTEAGFLAGLVTAWAFFEYR